MSKSKKFLVICTSLLILGLLGFLYYYIYLPVFNIHSPDLWLFVISLLFISAGLYKVFKFKTGKPVVVKGLIYSASFVAIIFALGSILSSKIVNAKKYQSLINVETRNFNEDIPEISYEEIPILDKATAINLGSRKMGSMVEMVSQFEVNNLYTQINYQSKPTRVTPLDYGNFFKWLANRKLGIPAYIKIDMATQEVDLVKLENEYIKYSFSEPLNRNVKRYLRFKYPTYIFDNINFEINDEGVPFWVAPVRTYTIGLFGGPVIKKVVLLNAINGNLEEYNVNEVPNWVDSVYSANLLVSYFDYYGTLKNGFLNSILGQKGALKSTDGYNYIALNNDVWVYTGVTSVGSDKSNVGFVLMNQRTAETRYYEISGAQETSAMASAEGQVQHLGYRATFPLLLNIANQPTYFMALKDEAGLVKNYAMVNVAKYQIVAIGSTVLECERNYISLMSGNNITSDVPTESKDLSGKISYLKEIIIDGNSYILLKINGSQDFYAVCIKDNLNILNYKLEDEISFTYENLSNYNLINKIK